MDIQHEYLPSFFTAKQLLARRLPVRAMKTMTAWAAGSFKNLLYK
jgi:hypothetical protein